jgi:translation elongation factor EF-4
MTIALKLTTIDIPLRDGETYQFNLIDTPGHVDFAATACT